MLHGYAEQFVADAQRNGTLARAVFVSVLGGLATAVVLREVLD